MRGAKVLIVEDEPDLLRALEVGVSGQEFDVTGVASGEVALESIGHLKPDLVVLDLMLPGIDGYTVCQKIRATSSVPIIVLSAKGGDTDKIQALDYGADDYLTKPFSMGELIARVRAAIRRSGGARSGADAVFQSGDFVMDFIRRRVSIGGQEIRLTPTEYSLLKVLVGNAGRVVTRRQLLAEVWGATYHQESHYLHVYISQIRRKIEADPNHPRRIVSEPGVGYRFDVEESETD